MNREDVTPEDHWRWAVRQTAASFALSGIPTRFDPVAEIDRLRALVELAWDQGPRLCSRDAAAVRAGHHALPTRMDGEVRPEEQINELAKCAFLDDRKGAAELLQETMLREILFGDAR